MSSREADIQRSLGIEVLENDDAFRAISPTVAEPGLRIGVSGAQGTGITTVARGLAQQLGLPMLSEVARCAFEHGFTLGDEGSIRAQCAMWFAQTFLEARSPSFVADRVVVDAAAHALLLADMTGDKQDRLIAEAMSNATALAMQHYTALFFMPIEFPLVFDGVRKGDTEFQQKLDAKFRHLFDRLSLDYIELRGTPEERVAQAMGILEQRGV